VGDVVPPAVNGGSGRTAGVPGGRDDALADRRNELPRTVERRGAMHGHRRSAGTGEIGERSEVTGVDLDQGGSVALEVALDVRHQASVRQLT